MRLKTILLLILLNFFTAAISEAQTVVDKTVATVSDGVETELITYSDLLWQLALEPDAPINPPRREDLEAAFERLVQQRLIALEAERLPASAPNEAAVTAEIRRVVEQFPAPAVFEQRLRQVGFNSIEDPNFRRIVERRLAIERYLDFRFRSFVVVTPEDEERFYNEVYAPAFRQRNPGVIVPKLEAVRQTINQQVTESRIEADINNFLKEARERAIVTTLYPI